MKPSPDLVLNQTFAKIAMEMGPALPAGYGQGSATTTGVLLLMVAQEFNRAADIRVKENAAMRALFADAGVAVGGELGQRLLAAAGTKDADVNVATLDHANGELKTLLIELHVEVEETSARELEVRIGAFLRDAATARQVFLPAM
ncbi:MAG: hypothetical protein SGJ03_16265 [Alphaproteobacteria bacterium]|nr:hypothetical protein [Alphaproteobacteria bacterium]